MDDDFPVLTSRRSQGFKRYGLTGNARENLTWISYAEDFENGVRIDISEKSTIFKEVPISLRESSAKSVRRSCS